MVWKEDEQKSEPEVFSFLIGSLSLARTYGHHVLCYLLVSYKCEVEGYVDCFLGARVQKCVKTSE